MAQETFIDPPMPDILDQWRHYLALLGPEFDDRILDVGCGTGDAGRLLVRSYPEVAEIIGLEKNVGHYSQAHRQAEQESTRLSFHSGDAQELPFETGSFDKVLCVDTLEWIAEPAQAAAEMYRVLRPGGIALFIHSDFDTQVFNSTDRQLCRRIVHTFSDAGPNGQIGRELAALCRMHGFSRVDVSVFTLCNTQWEPNYYSYRMAHMMVEWLQEDSSIESHELQSWLDDLARQQADSRFFYSINRNICRCVK